MSMKTRRVLTGEAGEHLVCCELLLGGYQADIVHGFPYDLLLDDGERIHRVQVKTARKGPRGYRFAYGGNNNRRYGKEVDLFAFVFLDERKIYYQRVPEKYSYKEARQNEIRGCIEE